MNVAEPDKPVPDTARVKLLETCVAVVAVVALVAVVADVALPLKVAVIVPALKLPEASRATTLEAVLAEVASTAAVTADPPL